MFIGHFAVGFASKAVAPRTSLGWLMLAPMFCDVLWPVFLATGVERTAVVPGYTAFTPLDLHDIPWSHSLVMVLLWSALLGGAYFALRREGRGAWVIGCGVFSHFLLDFVTHRPEMQLYPGAPHVLGLELWASIPGTVVTETLLFASGVLTYVRVTRPMSRRGTVSFAAFVGLLSLAYLGNLVGPPPPSWQAVMYVAFASILLVPWAHAFDRAREVRT